jgi:hypothetical protein
MSNIKDLGVFLHQAMVIHEYSINMVWTHLTHLTSLLWVDSCDIFLAILVIEH